MTAGSAAYGHVCPTVSELNSDQKLIHHAEGRELETAIIKWIVATVLASAALAFAIAKFVH
jgi:hypothetical protein